MYLKLLENAKYTTLEIEWAQRIFQFYPLKLTLPNFEHSKQML